MITYKKHYKSLIVLGVPIIIGQLGTIVQSFADTVMVGHYGTLELSSAGFTNNVFNLILIAMMGFSYGSTPVIGGYYGRGDQLDAGRVMKESILSNIMVWALALFAATIVYVNLENMGQPSELMHLIKPYFLVLLASLLPQAIFNAMKQFCDGVADTRTPMWIMLMGNVLNIIGNYCLIFGKFGCPEMGLLGAGLSTLFARIVMAISIVGVVFASARYKVYISGFKMPATHSGFKHLCRLGFPISLQMGMEASSFNICAVMMGWLGAGALAAHQIMCTVGSLCFMIYYGIGASTAVRISHFRGRGDWVEVRRSAFAGFSMTLLAGVCISCMIFIFRTELISLFTSDADVVAIALTIIPPLMIYQFGDSMQTVFANALRAIEDVKMMMIHAFIAYVLVSIPLSALFAFGFGWGPAGIWYAFPFGLTTAGVLFYTRFNAQTKKKLV